MTRACLNALLTCVFTSRRFLTESCSLYQRDRHWRRVTGRARSTIPASFTINRPWPTLSSNSPPSFLQVNTPHSTHRFPWIYERHAPTPSRFGVLTEAVRPSCMCRINAQSNTSLNVSLESRCWKTFFCMRVCPYTSFLKKIFRDMWGFNGVQFCLIDLFI